MQICRSQLGCDFKSCDSSCHAASGQQITAQCPVHISVIHRYPSQLSSLCCTFRAQQQTRFDTSRVSQVSMGKVCLITGGNSGIGFAAAGQLLKAGHKVILACRDAGKAKSAVLALEPAAAASCSSVEYVQLDLASLSSVRTCATDLLSRYGGSKFLFVGPGAVQGTAKERG